MAIDNPELTIGKLDAARRQLQTAIKLWFHEGDPVAIHTLAFSAYEIIHALSKKRNPGRAHLIYDTPYIKDEHRAQVNTQIKAYGNFFKHADRDGDAVIKFRAGGIQWFMFFALLD